MLRHAMLCYAMQVEALARYLCDLSLGEYNLRLQHRPSEVAWHGIA